jgi:class 3 adenylate cyclase
MASLLQSSVGLLRSRLSRRIVAWVFLSIIVIEGVIFVPAFFRRRREKLRDLEQVSSEVLFTVKSRAMAGATDEVLLDDVAQNLKPDSVIRGIGLFKPDGTPVEIIGEAPELSCGAVEAQGSALRRLNAAGDRYDVAWPSSGFQGEYVLMVRHDATGVHREMGQYALAIAGLVIIISAFVTFVTILVLERILIVPVLYMRDDLLKAGAAVGRNEKPNFYTASSHRRDELGEVARAFQEMYERVWQEISDRKAAEAALQEEQQKSEKLLLNILPLSIADQLKAETGAIASRFEEATILFADIVDFTGLSAQVSPNVLVCLLNDIFSAFDEIAERYGLEKIKTIGDAYMVVGGLPQTRTDHAEAILAMAIEMQTTIQRFKRGDGQPFHLRIGINTGPVVAGVIGIKKFSYDLWGDAVNIASRMESHGVIDRIQISATTYQHLKHRYRFEDRGCIDIKGRGPMHTYLYDGPKPLSSPPLLPASVDVQP